MNDYFMFISAEKATFPINWMCRKLKVSRASFYRWLRPAAPTKAQLHRNLLDAHVVRIYEREKGKAGRDQIAILLAQEVARVAIDTVGSILRGRGLSALAEWNLVRAEFQIIRLLCKNLWRSVGLTAILREKEFG